MVKNNRECERFMSEKEVQEKIRKLQEMQQQMQSLLVQKQNVNLQKTEFENALKELKKESGQAYEIVGTVMIKKTTKELIDNIQEKNEITVLRLNSIDKQINKITTESSELQKVITQEMQTKK